MFYTNFDPDKAMLVLSMLKFIAKVFLAASIIIRWLDRDDGPDK